MAEWKDLLRRDRTEWLLEASDPPVRYWTQVWILGLRPGDPELERSRAAVASSGPVRRLVETQKAPGYWGSNPLPRLLDWLLSLQGRDGSVPCPSKAGSPACVFATTLLLRLVEAIAPRPDGHPRGKERPRAISAAAAAGAGFLLDGGMARAGRNRPTERWYTCGRPLLWDSDILEVYRSLKAIGA